MAHVADEEKNVLPVLAARATEQQLDVLGSADHALEATRRLSSTSDRRKSLLQSEQREQWITVGAQPFADVVDRPPVGS